MEEEILLRSCFGSIYDNNFTGVDIITKKALNNLTRHRTTSIQKAVHDLAGLPLVLCSDVIVNLPLGAAKFLRERKTASIQKERHR